ncbi:MAG: SCP2 sterol-binding domain-containing protein [Gammaproteobacteria bacterium]|nr:SCP2 sterol-binding domain-containing protein [Gammaproteobacteria bacterium]MDH5800278.1 SCP2 sterol-binding domain-containing protein [Gammaproteobacteria bacterium]
MNKAAQHSSAGKSLLHSTFAQAIEQGVRAVLQLDSDSAAQLQLLQGKVLALCVTDLDIRLYFIFGDPIQVVSYYEGFVNTELRAGSVAFAAMGLQRQGSDALFKGDVTLQGEIQTGEQFQKILRNMDIDWEELLSRVTGDIVAHKVGSLFHNVFHWGRNTLSTLSEDVVEYAQQEIQVLPSPYEIQKYLADVDVLRADVDRLNARLNKLQQSAFKANRNDSQTGKN